MKLTNSEIEFSSFKDKDAVVFYQDNEILRRISKDYIPTFNKFINSKLYEKLLEKNLIVPFIIKEQKEDFIIIKPEKLTITYPFEWSFSQLKDCAIATLKIQKIALEYGFTLKDANFFNIQFLKNKPVLMDTTSFEIYQNNQIWTPYKQFCENFLAPLALISFVDIKMSDLLIKNINGIPLELASKLLPLRTYFHFGLLNHIHLQAKFQKKYNENLEKIDVKLSKNNLKNLIENLLETVKSIKLPKKTTGLWQNYYKNTNYSENSFNQKREIIENFKNKINPKSVIDFGANTGIFTRIFNECECFSLDFDMMAVECNYLKTKEEKTKNITPLVFDISNPTPAVGFFNKERKDFLSRINNKDVVLALALIHHLRFNYNLPFEKIAQYFSNFGSYLIIEFVQKDDSKVQQILKNRKDVFDDYTENEFERAFEKFYRIIEKQPIINTKRILYLMEKI